MESHFEHQTLTMLAECSTLFSIEDGITGRRLGGPDRYEVLNAFQHRRWNHVWPTAHHVPHNRCSTLFSIEDGITTKHSLTTAGFICAQRFSASKMESLQNDFLCEWHHACAQRFSASKMESLSRCGRGGALYQVLNAFQHRRWNHTPRRPSRRSPGPVLNAFQHRRWNHIEVNQEAKQIIVCSTLFSIEDGITAVGRSAVKGDCVLNAFQHRRWNHRIGAASLAGPLPVLNAFQHRRWNHTARQE